MANLVVCLDGTWNNADSTAPQTNVAILSGLVDLRRTGNAAQQLYYDPGVGTGGNLLRRLAGGITGQGLSANILGAYRFLSLAYRPGDNIYLFGYSRGAFTIRSLSGFIAASGLLRAERCDKDNLNFAWHYYRTKPKERFPSDHAKLRAMSYADVRIRFLGVFDTVGSLGIPRQWLNWVGRRSFQFHDTELCSIVDHSCHALAIDEHRMEFEAAVWDVPRRGGYQTVEQVWFPGVHANVGGGCEDKGLSDLTLDWMLKRVRRYCPELALRPVHLEPDHRGVLYDPRTWLYWRSIRRPLIRLINRCPVKRGAQRIRLARVRPHSQTIGEMLHWSALLRYLETRKLPAKKRYAPINLLAALESAKRGATLIVGLDGEPGPYLKAPTMMRPVDAPTARLEYH
jgi:T6SS, Phospholipase effector Tle1-like, catalytic domain